MSKDLAKDGASLEYDRTTLALVVESVVTKGDISGLSPEAKARFYVQMCEQLGLNPATQPLAVLRLQGKEILYPTRGATDQLAAIHRLTREIVDGPRVMDLGGTKLVYAVCKATLPNGRVETAVATVPLTDPANVLMKCETKAKRRATLSILGLGMLDESELDTIPASAKEPAPAIDLGVLDAKQNEPTARELLDTSLAKNLTVADVAATWISHRGRFEKGTPAAQAAWLACVLSVIDLLGLVDNKGARQEAKRLLLEAIKAIELNEPPPNGSHSTGEHEAAPPTAADGAAEAAAIAAEGTLASQWIQKTREGYHKAFPHLVRSFVCHHGEFGTEFESAELALYEVALRDWGCGRLTVEKAVLEEETAHRARAAKARRANLRLVRRAA